MSFDAWKAYLRGDYRRAGDLYHFAGKPQKALQMYIKAKEYQAAAAIELELRRINDAVNHLIQAGEHDQAIRILIDSNKFDRAAKIYAEMGNMDKAVAIALEGKKPALAAQFREAEGMLYEAGILYRKAGQTAKALLLFEKALRRMPSIERVNPAEQNQWREKRRAVANAFVNAEEYFRAAQVFQEVDDLLSAARCFEKGRFTTRAIDLYKRLGDTNKVKELSAKADETDPDIKADAQADQGETDDAVKALLKAGKVDKAAAHLENTGELFEAALLWREAHEYERAGNLFFQCEAYRDAGLSFQQAGLHQLAMSAFEKDGDLSAASKMALEAHLWEKAFDLAQNQHDREYLIKFWQSTPEASPKRTLARFMLGRTFLEVGQPELAKECLHDLPHDIAEEPWLLYLQGRIHEAEGESSEATTIFRQVLAKDIGFQDTKQRLNELSSKKKSKKESIEHRRYKFSDEVDRDYMGPWIRAEDLSLQCPVLIHRLEAITDADLRETLQAASREVLGLRHGAVLALRDVIPEGDDILQIHEGFEGEPQEPMLWEGEPVGLYQALDRARPLLEVLREAHGRGLTHGNLTPSSILLDEENRVKVRGFGHPYRFRGVHLEALPVDEALLPFLAPETGSEQAPRPEQDLYFVGSFLYRLLTGSPPPVRLDKDLLPLKKMEPVNFRDVPSAPRPILSKLLASKPGERYGVVDDVLRDLESLALPPGAVIAERYEILEELGRGGMGQVFRVRDKHLDEIVALKTLRYGAGIKEGDRARFLREIKLTRKITHPNVIRVFDLGQHKDLTFLTMEFIPGLTLTNWIKGGSGDKVSLGEKVHILRQTASGLSEAHRLGIVHRDLKPQNVILTPESLPKLLDFGIAYAQEGADLTQEGHFVGSPKYVSPEQIQGRVLDQRSDIYSFGLLAYFLITGKEAFAGESATDILLRQLKETPPPPSRYTRISKSLEKLIMKCLEKDPDNRPASMKLVQQELEQIA